MAFAFACESLGSLGCFSTIIFCVVHVISHMVTLSLPFCLLYLCSVFKVQSWISDVRYWILDLIPIPFLKTIVPGVPLPVFKRLPSRIVCGFTRWWAQLRVTLCLMAYVFLAVSPSKLSLGFLPGFSLSVSRKLPSRIVCGFTRWWAQVDSNHRPHAYQACALTT